MAGSHDKHRIRMRERYFKDGMDNFQPHEVLELLLFNVIPRGDTNELGHRLIKEFGSVSGVFEASYPELLRIDGVGPKSAFLLHSIASVARYYLEDKNGTGLVLDTTEKRGRFILPKFIGKNTEHVYLICLDRKYKLLHCELIAEGTLNCAPVTVSRIISTAVRVNASFLILAHNHTQGQALPSADDTAVTYKVRDALHIISAELIDHLIVARDDFISMADSNLLR